MQRVINIKYCIKILLYLFILYANFSCAISRQQELIAEQHRKQKKLMSSLEAQAYYVKFICPREAEKYVESRYLDFPYSVKIHPGETISFVLYYPDTGQKYGGELYAMGEDVGNYGKYPGYELCISDELLLQADMGQKIVFYLQSPRGEIMVRITLWRGS